MRWLEQGIAPDFSEIVATRLHELRHDDDKGRAHRYTQRAVAEAIGVRSASTISYLVRGKRITMLRPEQFWRLAELLRFAPSVMLEAAGYMYGERRGELRRKQRGAKR